MAACCSIKSSLLSIRNNNTSADIKAPTFWTDQVYYKNLKQDAKSLAILCKELTEEDVSGQCEEIEIILLNK